MYSVGTDFQNVWIFIKYICLITNFTFTVEINNFSQIKMVLFLKQTNSSMHGGWLLEIKEVNKWNIYYHLQHYCQIKLLVVTWHVRDKCLRTCVLSLWRSPNKALFLVKLYRLAHLQGFFFCGNHHSLEAVFHSVLYILRSKFVLLHTAKSMLFCFTKVKTWVLFASNVIIKTI